MKIDRLIGILSILLQREKVTAPFLAEKFEVSRRTINRDVENLCQAGIPIVTERGANGGISVMDGYKIDKTLLTDKEMQALLAGLQSLDSVSGTNKHQLLMNKLSLRRSDVLNSNNHILIDLSSRNIKSLTPKIEMLQVAIERHQLVSTKYYAPGGESERMIEPYLLIFQWFAWYVWSYCRLRQEFRLFKLSRMDETKVLEETFSPRKIEEMGEIPLDTYNPDSIIVRAVFDGSIKWRLIEEFGRDRLQERENGKIEMEFTWSDKDSLFIYLLGFREHVELLEPKELRREFIELVRGISEKYE